MKLDINKFSFAQMTANNDGKTSGSGTLGVFAGFAGVLGFLWGIIDYSFFSKDSQIMTESIVVITLGAGLLGYRKSISSKDAPAEAPEEVKP